MTMHDEALAMKIKSTLASDKRMSNLPIEVRVSGSEVFLKGKVDSPEQVDCVHFMVSGVAGVRSVNADELEIREEGR